MPSFPSEFSVWIALRSQGRCYKANGCRSQDRKRLRSTIRLAAEQHWTIPQIAEATTLAPNTVRKYIK